MARRITGYLGRGEHFERKVFLESSEACVRGQNGVTSSSNIRGVGYGIGCGEPQYETRGSA
jgi:hypothetical protein